MLTNFGSGPKKLGCSTVEGATKCAPRMIPLTEIPWSPYACIWTPWNFSQWDHSWCTFGSTFYCATPKFLWPRAKICQHTAEYVMGSTESPTISSLNNPVSSYYYYLILVILLTYCNKVIVLK